MPRILRILIILAVLGALGVFAYAWQFGGFRVQRDADRFATAIESCTPFEQDYWVPLINDTLSRGVGGPEGKICVVTLSGIGAEQITCRVDADARALMARRQREDAASTGFWGRSFHIQYDSANPDPYTALLNSPACTVQ